jgi:hypothetical protein
MSTRRRGWKQSLPGEHLIFGTVLGSERKSAKSLHGNVTVRGPSHVGVYEVNLDQLTRALGRELKKGDGWNLFVSEKDGKILPERLYIGSKKIYPLPQPGGHMNHVVHGISKMYVPYIPQEAQGSFNFTRPWEDGFDWRKVRYHD